MEQLERVQDLATKWILGTAKTILGTVKAKRLDRDLKPLLLYIEMHDFLVSLSLINNQYDLKDHYENTRQANRSEFKIAKS